MASASSSHWTSPKMMRSRSGNTFCATGGGGDDDNGLTQVDASLPSVTKTTGSGAIGKGGTDGGSPTLRCHHHGHFDPYYYVILGSL